MKREDLRTKIVSGEIKSRDEFKEIITNDLIYIDGYNEHKDSNINERGISATDYAKMNNLYVSDFLLKTNLDKNVSRAWLRDGYYKNHIHYVSTAFDISISPVENDSIGVCPALRYSLRSDISKPSIFKWLKNVFTNNKEFDIKSVRSNWGKILYHMLQIGEYPKSKVDENLSRDLEILYNNGKLSDEIKATGRWFSCNGQKVYGEEYSGKHSPEFEYKGKRYVRVVSQIYNTNFDALLDFLKPRRYSDGTVLGKDGTVRWVKVEPISFIIRNWDDLPKSINPKGNGKATYFDLRAEEVVFGNLPFYPDGKYSKSIEWESSYIRGFLNGLDIRKINEEEFDFYKAEGGNFTGECNFLNEAFNLSREPIVEYAIPDGEFEIADDAFNGCVTLKKIIVHPDVRKIGKNAFEGLGFKYAYRTENGILNFSKELPKNREEYISAVLIENLHKSFVDFDYTMLVEIKNLDEIARFVNVLNKKKYSLPYVYASTLLRYGKATTFCENSYFKFFKKELHDINNILSKYPEEEKLDFFKFANVLGCFSKQKILDNDGIETQTIMAQKASLLLAGFIKTNELKLR